MTQQQLVSELAAGIRSWHKLPAEWSEAKQATVRLKALELLHGSSYQQLLDTQGVVEAAAGVNAENMLGVIQIPVGIVGPVRFEYKNMMEEALVPMATTEGALIASVSRGVKLLNLSQPRVTVEEIGVTRAGGVVAEDEVEAVRIVEWLESLNHWRQVFEEGSKHLGLIRAEAKREGRVVLLKVWARSGAAMGMNMVSMAMERILNVLGDTFAVTQKIASVNWCADKKPAVIHAQEGRGMRVRVEVKISQETLSKVLHVDQQAIVEVCEVKLQLGSDLAGILGGNAQIANVVAAVFVATGQDLAHVVEASHSKLTWEEQGDDIKFDLEMPSVMVGVVGGGTSLPSQQASLRMMKCDEVSVKSRERLAAILGVVALAGEMSLLGALASGDLGRAHQTLNRRKS